MSDNLFTKQKSHFDSELALLDSNGDRRFVTVLFCDLVSSTSMADNVDPEELQEVLSQFHRYCGVAINRYGGNISQLLGDGVLAYFGFPFVYEDNAHRAIRAGLEILDGLQQLSSQLRSFAKMEIQARIGIDTGLVVTSGQELFFSGQAPGVIGKAPNIAAKLQGLANPNSILITSDTERLIQGMFILNSLGNMTIEGLCEPIHVFKVIDETDAHSRFEAAANLGLTPFVGRENEMHRANALWQQVGDDAGYMMLIQGDPGIGKTRLIKNIEDSIAGTPHLILSCYGSPYFKDSALYPILSALKQVLYPNKLTSNTEIINWLSQLLSDLDLAIDEYLPLWAGLFSISTEAIPLTEDSVSEQKRKLAFSIIRWFEMISSKQALLLIFEDLHWFDPSSLDLISQIIEQGYINNTLIILSCRTEFNPPWPESQDFCVKLSRLNNLHTRSMISAIACDVTIEPHIILKLLETSDGIPLFIEESTKMTMALGPQNLSIIPDTLQDLLSVRLDQLGDNKHITQVCAVLGKRFKFEVLLAVSELDSKTLQQQLDQLLKAQILFKLHVSLKNTYEFRHALIQEAAYQSLLIRNRQQYHLRIAKVLMRDFQYTTPELIAHHCTEAKLYPSATQYWKRAGIIAVNNSAGLEATSHFKKSLTAIAFLDSSTQRDGLELEVQILLGSAQAAIKGYASFEIIDTFRRAEVLCERVNDQQRLFLVIFGLWRTTFSLSRNELAHTLAKSLLDLAEKFNDPVTNLVANAAIGISSCIIGEIKESIRYLERAINLYEPDLFRSMAIVYGQDLCLASMGWLVLAKESIGESQDARQVKNKVIRLARENGHTFSLVHTLLLSCIHSCLIRKYDELNTNSQELMQLSNRHGFEQMFSEGKILYAFSQAKLGSNINALEDCRRALIEYEQSNSKVCRPFYYSLLAKLYKMNCQYDLGLTAIKRSIDMAIVSNDQLDLARLLSIKSDLTELKIAACNS